MSVAMVRSSGYNRIRAALTSDSFAALYYPVAYDRFPELDAKRLDLTDRTDLEARIHKFFFPTNTPTLKSAVRNESTHQIQPLPSAHLNSSTVGLGFGIKADSEMHLSASQCHSSNDTTPNSREVPTTPIIPPFCNTIKGEEDSRQLEHRLDNLCIQQNARVARQEAPRQQTDDWMSAPYVQRNDTLGPHSSGCSTPCGLSTPPIVVSKGILSSYELSRIGTCF